MKVLTLGDELLRQKSLPVEEVTLEIKALAEDMFTTMIQKEGVGLAAPQVGILKRLFVLIADDDVRRVFINPQIIEQTDLLLNAISKKLKITFYLCLEFFF